MTDFCADCGQPETHSASDPHGQFGHHQFRAKALEPAAEVEPATDPAATLALCSWLKKRVGEWEAAAKTALALETGERKAARLNGVTISYTNKAKGRKTVQVHDEPLLLEYVRQFAPTEIEYTEQINAAYRKKILDRVLKDGKLIGGVDEVWDCVEVVEGDPFLTTKLTDEGPIVIAGLLASGRIGVDGIQAIEGGQ